MKSSGKEILKIRKLPELGDIRLVTGIDILNDFPRHIHRDYCIGLITSGMRNMSVSGEMLELAAGDIFAVNPGEPHTSLSAGGRPHSYIVLIIPETFINIAAGNSSGEPLHLCFINTIKDDIDAAARFKELTDVLNESDSLLEKESLLYSFIEYMAVYHSVGEVFAREDCAGSHVKAARDYIDKHYTEDISLEHLSEIADISPFHLNRLFTSQTGISPHAYLIHRRIECSKRLLLEGHSIAYVSAESGFADQSHFTKFFKKITGTTPGRFVHHNTE